MAGPLHRFLLRWKISAINGDISREISRHCRERFSITWYGAYDIDPKHLVFWVCVQSDAVKDRLAANLDLKDHLRSLLTKNKYPAEARDQVAIGFESQETVDRESEGNWFLHFK